MNRFIKFLQNRSPELYFRFMEGFATPKMKTTVIGYGNYVEEYGWEFRGRFYPKHYRVEPPPLTIRQQAKARIEKKFQQIGMLESPKK